MTAVVAGTSAIVAIPRNEPEKDRFVDVLLAARSRLMSAVNLQETGMVIAGRFGDDAAWQPLDGRGRKVYPRKSNVMCSYSPGRLSSLQYTIRVFVG